MPVGADAGIREILEKRTVAVVGCSSTPGKDAHEVPAYLQRASYEIIPVNPNATEVLGRTPYDTLLDITEEIEIVEVFRPSDEVVGIVEEAINREDVEVVWVQLGIHDEEAVARAESAGLRVVQDRCMRSEHRRLIGSL